MGRLRRGKNGLKQELTLSDNTSTNSTLRALRGEYNQFKGRAEEVERALKTHVNEIRRYNREVKFTEEAQAITRVVAKQTQDQIVYHLSDIVSLALITILDEPYEFITNVVEKRGKVECEFKLKKGNHPISPFRAGGGVVDIISTALRFAIWALRPNQPVIILDEPFKHLSRGYHERAGEVLKDLSKRLKLQIIMITHSPQLINKADKVFNVSIKGGVSTVTSTSPKI